MRPTLTAVLIILCAAIALHAEERPTFHIARATDPPKVDGILNDEAWAREPLPLGEWVSYNPLRGGDADPRTEVRIAYDDCNRSFAFHCVDAEPATIRARTGRPAT